ncbi:MAG TPA: NAD(P)H-binding protein, partial [Streptosporangiaceae bacterium]|nr:NAD(P)H-binding protein [Streptosporangiaceae bacterium]
IRDEALRRGHTVISVSRKEAELAGTPGFISRAGNLHDPALIDHMAVEADVIVVAVRAGQQDGVRLADSITTLAKAAAEHSTRLGFVGGAGSLHVTEGGPRVVDLPTFPEAHKGEALGQADVLAALRETTADVDWFYLSPAASFGAQAPGQVTGHYRLGGDVLLADPDGNSNISGADYAKAFVDEIEKPEHRRQRFSVAY